MHKLLARQLRRHFGMTTGFSPELQLFVDDVEQAYLQSDDDRAMLEHSMETVSDELVDRFQRMHDALESNQAAKAELNHAVSLLSATLESTADGILVVDRAGKMVQTNRLFAEMWRIPDDIISSRDDTQALHFVLDQLVDPHVFVAKVQELYGTPESQSFDELAFKDGRIFERYSLPQRVGGEIVGRVWSFRDVTARRQLADQLRQAHKMEAIGTLAGGVAHDFNNLLTVIRCYAELLEAEPNLSASSAEGISEITKAAVQASALTQQLLAFSRKQVLHSVALDVNEVIASLLTMMRRLVGEHITISIAPAAVGGITADRSQIEQVILNLVVNARDAMPRGGHITISTEDAMLSGSSKYEQLHGLPSGAFVRLTVADTGAGIAPEHRERVFEPFFTTKDVGRGTGLGLASVHGAVKQSAGYMVLESELGKGAAFSVYLPTSVSEHSLTPRSSDAIEDLGGTETILLVEDEEVIRRVVARLLKARGYAVLAACDGVEALRLVAEHAGSIHLVLTDVIMPGASGVEVAAEIHDAWPAIRVLYMSGYAPNEINQRGVLTVGKNLIQKPFNAIALAHAVRAALDRATVDSS